MSYAICKVPLAALRLAADHRSEMTSQLLFGEYVMIDQMEEEGWWLVECCFDGYKGYAKANQLLLVDKPVLVHHQFASGWINEVLCNDQLIRIPFGASLSFLDTEIPGFPIQYNGSRYMANKKANIEEHLQWITHQFLNTTYVWGGKSVFGIDCSGFVQTVFKLLAHRLPRDANQQVAHGTVVGVLQDAVCGDLAFFDEAGEITHVGILLNNHTIIHASGHVRIDPIDQEGIVNAATGKRTHQLKIIKRIIE